MGGDATGQAASPGRSTGGERRFARAMVLVAHPDDAEFMCGGTVARWAREGCEVHYVVCTDGSAGSNEPGARREDVAPIRSREQRAAADVLGVASVTFLGEPDGLLEVTPRTRKLVCRQVRRLRPDVLIAQNPDRLWSETYINHWDHKQAGLLALTAVMPDAPTRVMFQELEEEGIEPFEVPNLWLGMAEDADIYVDITGTIDTKVEALAQHVSEDGAEAGGWVRERAAKLGAEAGYAFAEGFKTFRLRDDGGDTAGDGPDVDVDGEEQS